MTVAFLPELVSQSVGGNGPELEGSILEETLQPNHRLTAKSKGRENNGVFPDGTRGKEATCQCRRHARDADLIPG